MQNAKTILLCLVLAASAECTAFADIYQYVDENGVVHFTNVPTGPITRTARVHRETRPSRPSTAPPARQSAPADRKSDEVPASYLTYIDQACEKYGVDPSLVRAIVKVESDYNPFALSRKGAMGLMQLMPQTALDMNVKNSFSPQENIEGGVRYLRYLMDRYEGNLSLSLAAYNSGETAVKKWGTIPPFKETKDYVRKVLALYQGAGRTTMTPRFTIYVGTGPDGTLLLTDNPSNHPGRTLHERMERQL